MKKLQWMWLFALRKQNFNQLLLQSAVLRSLFHEWFLVLTSQKSPLKFTNICKNISLSTEIVDWNTANNINSFASGKTDFVFIQEITFC